MSQQQQIAAACVVMLGISIAASPAAGAIIRLKSRGATANGMIRLGDVADVFDDDTARAEQLRGIPIAPAPAADRETELSYALIRARLIARGVNMAKVEFVGSSQVTVIGPHEESTAQDKNDAPEDWRTLQAERILASEIEKHIRRQDADAGHFSVKVQVPPREVYSIIQAANRGYEVIGGKPPWRGTQEFLVRYLDRNERIEQLQLRVSIDVPPSVLVATRALRRGDRLADDDLEWRQVEESASGGFESLREVVGMEVRRGLRPGAVITADDIQPVPLVRNNEIVSVTSRVGQISVKRDMRSRGTAGRGEKVTLVSLDGRERVVARVTGYNEAEVVSPGTPSVRSTLEEGGRIRFIQDARPGRRSTTRRYQPYRRR